MSEESFLFVRQQPPGRQQFSQVLFQFAGCYHLPVTMTVFHMQDEQLDHSKEVPKCTGKIEEEIKAALRNILVQTSMWLEIK